MHNRCSFWHCFLRYLLNVNSFNTQVTQAFFTAACRPDVVNHRVALMVNLTVSHLTTCTKSLQLLRRNYPLVTLLLRTCCYCVTLFVVFVSTFFYFC